MLVEVLFLVSLGTNTDCYKGLEEQQPYRYTSGYVDTANVDAAEDYKSYGGKEFCMVTLKSKERVKPVKGNCHDLLKGKCAKHSCQPRK
jgi:hypothetical protein